MEWSEKQEIVVPTGEARLPGVLVWPEAARAVVLFAHGSGSSRHSPRNNYVAQVLNRVGIATLLTDLLTPEEDWSPQRRFDIGLLTARLADTTDWLLAQSETPQPLRLGYFGASTGAAAALRAAAKMGERIAAVVSRGGRPDLAGDDALPLVSAPTLLIVGGFDAGVIELNQAAYAQLRCEKRLTIVPGATHLFEEPGTLEEVARLAARWFREHLAAGNETQTSS
jgi:putative phosphoribosyl transferase